MAVQDAHTKSVAAERVLHRKRITTPPVRGVKITFEIDRPNLIGTPCAAYCWPRAVRPASPPQRRARPSVPPQQPAQRTHGRNQGTRMLALQPDTQLSRPPAFVAVAGQTQPLYPQLRG